MLLTAEPVKDQKQLGKVIDAVYAFRLDHGLEEADSHEGWSADLEEYKKCTKDTQDYASSLDEYMREYDSAASSYTGYAAREDLLYGIEEYLRSQFSVDNFVTLSPDADYRYPGPDCCALYSANNYGGR